MTEDLYREVPCPKCGQKILAVASFCPYCGYVVGDSWFEKTKKSLRAEGSGQRNSKLFPVVMGLVIAGFLLYTAIVNESIEGLIVALLSAFFAIRSMFSGSPQSEQVHTEDEVVVHEAETVSDNPLVDNFFCENCGTKVSSDATECPKCGMKFG